MVAEDACENAVECAHPQARRHVVAGHGAYALTHLACGLVGECERHYAPWLHALRQQVGYLAGDDPRLAGTGSGNDELRAVAVQHGCSLGIVEVVQI